MAQMASTQRACLGFSVLFASVVVLHSAVCWSNVGLQPTAPVELLSKPAAVNSVSHLRGFANGAASAADAASEENPMQKAARAVLAVCAVFAVVAAGLPGSARADGGPVNIYFGQGCFWHVQHDLAQTEVKKLGRKEEDVTAVAGYAGGVQAGKGGEVCYHNMMMAPDYGQMGHTEVVNVQVPAEQVGEFAKGYIDAAASYRFGRADPQDRGTEYRSAIGLPGGIDSPLFKQLEEVNQGRLKFLRGEGGDRDTVGTKNIWVYDSDKFPFYAGEVYHQFHDDMVEKYSDKYHKLKDVMLKKGTMKAGACPEFGF